MSDNQTHHIHQSLDAQENEKRLEDRSVSEKLSADRYGYQQHPVESAAAQSVYLAPNVYNTSDSDAHSPETAETADDPQEYDRHPAADGIYIKR
ncbi:hypothetical protein K7432_008479 [Basidiobolus ranarum]|uniref:Uncharacterized protein n=1 Tax=Basidiobolus ranarum TaxID=34480 RepID=A0ABR2WRS1_9FUNG